MLLPDKVSQLSNDSNTVHDWVHGPASGIGSVVTTQSGTVRSPARLIADKDAEIGVMGTNLLATTKAQTDIATDRAAYAAGQATLASQQAILATTNGAAQVTLATTQKDLAITAKVAAELARDTTAINADVYISTSAALDIGVKNLVITASGSGGTNGTFAIAFSGGGGTGAAGTFTVTGGLVTAVVVTSKGTAYVSPPTASLSASTGLVGATVTAVISSAVLLGSQFQVVAADNLSVQRYRHDAGPVATAVGVPYPTYSAMLSTLANFDFTNDSPIAIALVESMGSRFKFNDVAAALCDESGKVTFAFNSVGAAYLSELYVDVLRSGTQIFDENTKATGEEANYAFAITDQNDKVSFGVLNGVAVADKLKAQTHLVGEDTELLSDETNYSFAVTDESGSVCFGVLGGRIYGAGLPLTSYIDRNQTNVLKSASLKTSINTSITRNTYKYNHVMVGGQSLSTGHEGWPALSKTAKYGNLMLGGCVRPISTSGASFSPFGGATLQPLIANVQSGGTLLSDAAVAALTAGDGSLGEVVNQGMVNFAKRLHNDYTLQDNDSTRLFVTTNNGVSGRTIEQLSKGASPEEYLRMTSSVSQIANLAIASSATYGVTCFVWMQGEYNYATNFGGSTDKAAYKAAMVTLRNNLNTDIAAITGQTRPPAFLTYQTGAGYTKDATNLSVGMAQWEFCKETTGCYLAGPIYPYTDKGGHLDSNGYRWYGNLLAKVFHKVVTLGQAWKPLSPTKIETVGRLVVIDFHVPEPPLIFSESYVTTTGTTYAAKGFRLTDDGGVVPISDVAIQADTVIVITASRDFIGTPYVWYASETTYSGNGNLRDSDSTVSHDNYEYLPGSGMYASANITSLVNKPYPMHNWCIAFKLPTTWSE